MSRNPAATWRARQRISRVVPSGARAAAHADTAGNRPGVGAILGLEGEEHDPETCGVFGCEKCHPPAGDEP